MRDPSMTNEASGTAIRSWPFRRRKFNLIRTAKMVDLMKLPPVARMSHSENSPELYYTKQLMQLWKECTEAKSPKPSSSGEKPSSSREQQPRNSPTSGGGFVPLEPEIPL